MLEWNQTYPQQKKKKKKHLHPGVSSPGKQYSFLLHFQTLNRTEFLQYKKMFKIFINFTTKLKRFLQI